MEGAGLETLEGCRKETAAVQGPSSLNWGQLGYLGSYGTAMIPRRPGRGEEKMVQKALLA